MTDAPAPHDFRDHKAHMQWKMEIASKHPGANVPLIPSDLSAGSRSQSTSAAALGKLTQNPLIPIGMIATTGCLIGIMAQTLKRNPHKAQLYMRGRCAAQFFTVCALVGGAYLFGVNRGLEPGKHGVPHQQSQ